MTTGTQIRHSALEGRAHRKIAGLALSGPPEPCRTLGVTAHGAICGSRRAIALPERAKNRPDRSELPSGSPLARTFARCHHPRL